jgi:hypothetical protein
MDKTNKHAIGCIREHVKRVRTESDASIPFAEQLWQFGDVAGNAPRLIKSQRVGDSCIARIGVAVDIGNGLLVGVHDLEAAVEGLNAPWWRKASHCRAPGSVSRSDGAPTEADAPCCLHFLARCQLLCIRECARWI